MSERVNLGKAAPELYKAVSDLDKLASQAIMSAGIAEGFSHLLRLRASQKIESFLINDKNNVHCQIAADGQLQLTFLPTWRCALSHSPACLL